MNWSYISGFFDADGSITAARSNKGKNRTIQVSFHNTQLCILEKISKFIEQELGYKGSLSTKKAKKANHSTGYELKYCYRKGLEVVNKLTLSHPKKIHRVKTYNLIQEKTKRNGKYTIKEQQEREELIKDFFSYKDS